MNRRHGTSLLEVASITAAGSVVVAVAVGVLYTLFRTQSAVQDHVHQSTVLSRMGEQFRSDVRAATAAGGTGDAALWRFARPPDRVVTYRAEPAGLVRIETTGRGLPRRERFSLPPGTAASIQLGKGPFPTIVSLVVEPAADGLQTSPVRIARFDALLAADHRFDRPDLPARGTAEPSGEDPHE